MNTFLSLILPPLAMYFIITLEGEGQATLIGLIWVASAAILNNFLTGGKS